MAIIRRLNNLPMGCKRKFCEVSLPTVEVTSASSSSEDDEGSMSDDDGSETDTSSLVLTPERSTNNNNRVVSPYLGTRVHFAEDFEDEEEEDEQDDECPPPAADWDYLQEHKSDLWYAKDARQGFSQDALATIQTFKSEHPEPVSLFGSLYEAKALSDANDSTASENKDPSPRVTFNLPLTMRGLEWGITPTLKKKRQHHIRQVLLACDDITDQAKRERMVAARARKSSRVACSVAHKLAVGTDIVFVDDDGCSSNISSSMEERKHASTSDESNGSEPITGLPPREPLQSKRMRLWQR